MRFLTNNLITTDNITVNEPSISFPAENLVSNTFIERTQFDDYIVVDLGSAKNIKYVAYGNSSDAITIQANATDSWGSPTFSQVLTAEVTEIDQTFQFWRIYTGATASRLGYFSLSGFLQLPPTDGLHDRQEIKTDIKNPSSMSSIFPTSGYVYKSEEVNFPIVFLDERETFLDWWRSTDSAYNHYIIPFEENMTDFPPYFGNVLSSEETREKTNYTFKINIREAK